MLLSFSEFGNPTSVPIVILHGLFGAKENWQSIARRLSGHNRVITVDLRNHGASFHHPKHTYCVMADDVHTLLKHLNVASCIMIGHSMGGKVAMQYAQKFPIELEKLIVVDIAPVAYARHHDDILEALNRLPLDAIENKRDADGWLAKTIDDARVRQFLLTNLIRRDGHCYVWRMNLVALTTEYNHTAEAPSLNKPAYEGPTLFIRGGLSDYIVSEMHACITEYFPDNKIVTIENAGHWVQVEAPGVFLEAIQLLSTE